MVSFDISQSLKLVGGQIFRKLGLLVLNEAAYRLKICLLCNMKRRLDLRVEKYKGTVRNDLVVDSFKHEFDIKPLHL